MLHAIASAALLALVLAPPPAGAESWWSVDSRGAAPRSPRGKPVPLEGGTVTDPTGDTFGTGPVQHDIVFLQADITDIGLGLFIAFADSIEPADSGLPNALFGVVDFDTDQDPTTGIQSTADIVCPDPAGIGVDLILDMSGYDSATGTAPVVDDAGNFVTDALVQFGPQDFFANVFLFDGPWDAAAVMGTALEPTDCVPNGGFVTIPVFPFPAMGGWGLLALFVLTLGAGIPVLRRLGGKGLRPQV